MRTSRLIGALCTVLFPLLPTLSHAALIDRGGGLIYDDVLDITWLQDTNFALTNGDNDGKMGWQEANDWAAGLSYYDTVRGVSYSDWRLPGVSSPIDGATFDLTSTNNGTSDVGYARTTIDGSDGGWRDSSGTPVNEMGYMYYVNLGNFGKCDEDLSGCNTISRDWGLNNIGLFTNWSQIDYEPVDPSNSLGNYATGTDFLDEVAAGLDGDYVWHFEFTSGKSHINRKGKAGFPRLAAWAVRDGDVGVSAVPVPAAVWLFGSGLIGLVGVASRKKL